MSMVLEMLSTFTPCVLLSVLSAVVRVRELWARFVLLLTSFCEFGRVNSKGCFRKVYCVESPLTLLPPNSSSLPFESAQRFHNSHESTP